MADDNDKNQEEKSEKEKDKGGTKFPSSKIMLSVIQKENDLEVDRKKALEVRVTPLLALSGVLLLFFTNKADLSFLRSTNDQNYMENYIVFTLFFIAPLILLFTSILYFVRVLATKEYKRLGLDGFKEEAAVMAEDDIAMKLIIQYRELLKYNSQGNEKKPILFMRGIYSLIVALVLIVGMFVYLLLIK